MAETDAVLGGGCNYCWLAQTVSNRGVARAIRFLLISMLASPCDGYLRAMLWRLVNAVLTPKKKSMYCIPSHAKAISKRSTTNSVWCCGVFGNNSSCPPCTRWTGIGQYIAHPYDADEFAYPHVYRQTRTNEIQCQMFHVGGCHELTSNRCHLRPPETIFCFVQKD